MKGKTMFGYALVRKANIDHLLEENDYWYNQILDLQKELTEAKEENKRLWNFHHNLLTKPRKDKNGVLRHPDGRFASAK